MQRSHSQTAVHNKKSMLGKNIPAYHEDTQSTCPISLQEFELLKETVLWTEEDESYMHMSADILREQVENIADVWTSFISVYPHLSKNFASLEELNEQIKKWILYSATASYDEKWLSQQFSKVMPLKNFRYAPVLAYPLIATLKPFLCKKHLRSAEDVECMHQAWTKSVLLQLSLWSRRYVRDDEF